MKLKAMAYNLQKLLNFYLYGNGKKFRKYSKIKFLLSENQGGKNNIEHQLMDQDVKV